MTEFMDDLYIELLSKTTLQEPTIKKYIGNLFRINQGDFNNLQFLNNKQKVMDFINNYSVGTQKNYLTSILTILKTLNINKNIDFYENEFNKTLQKYIEYEPVLKEKQKEISISWNEIQKIKKNIYKKINKKNPTKNNIIDVINYFIASLYTDVEPRRNEWVNTLFVKSWNDKMPDNVNYVDLLNKQFIFNVYKTDGVYGQQIFSYKNNKPFINALQLYKRQRNIKVNKMKKNQTIPFLITYNNESLNHAKQLNRILNNIFGEHIGSSMLRHIYITHHHGEQHKLMKETANKMGHSTNTQQYYSLT
jgi:hypothetical protein